MHEKTLIIQQETYQINSTTKTNSHRFGIDLSKQSKNKTFTTNQFCRKTGRRYWQDNVFYCWKAAENHFKLLFRYNKCNRIIKTKQLWLIIEWSKQFEICDRKMEHCQWSVKCELKGRKRNHIKHKNIKALKWCLHFSKGQHHDITTCQCIISENTARIILTWQVVYDFTSNMKRLILMTILLAIITLNLSNIIIINRK